MKIERGNIILKLNAEEVDILIKAKRILDNITDNMESDDYIGSEDADAICDAMDTIDEILDNFEGEGF